MLRAIKPINRIHSRGTDSPTARFIRFTKMGFISSNGFNCLGILVRKLITQLATVIVNQIVVAKGITTSRPAIRSFFKSCFNRSSTNCAPLLLTGFWLLSFDICHNFLVLLHPKPRIQTKTVGTCHAKSNRRDRAQSFFVWHRLAFALFGQGVSINGHILLFYFVKAVNNCC